MSDVTVIILTKDETLHIARAIASVQGFARRVVVVDSGSSDDTVALAVAAGAEVLVHPWHTHAAQFNWALRQVGLRTEWVLRLDADEVASPELAEMIKAGLPAVNGIYLRRQIKFMGEPVRFGGASGLHTLRLFRSGSGWAEARWMDEHIVVNGPTRCVDAAITDDNQKPLGWWIAKHNDYASREVVDIVLRRHSLSDAQDAAAKAGVKRWVKDHFYARLPRGARAVLYFLYRYALRGGFRDRPNARRFHVLQGFWYRYLVDAKLAEVEHYIAETGAAPKDAITAVLGIPLPAERREVA